MLIDCSYFVDGPRHIQNATLGKMPNPNAEEVNAAIKAYIKEYQKEFLILMLGYDLGSAVNSYIETIPDYAIIRIVDNIISRKTEKGNEQSFRTVNEKKDKEANPAYDCICCQLCDPFADYVFYKILRNSSCQATMTGLVRLKCANDYVAPIRRQVSIWNAMVDKIRYFVKWCNTADCPISGINTDSNLLTKINSLNL